MKILLSIFYFFLLTINLSAQSHPYLIVKESEYPQLQQLADREPWSVIKDRALEAVAAIKYDEEPWRIKKYNLCSDLAGALALCYILYPDQREEYLQRFESDVSKFIHDIRLIKENSDRPGGHGYNVGPAQAAFHTYLALDIMYDSVGDDVRKRIEDDLQFIALHHVDNWEESKYAIEGMYALYTFGPDSKQFVDKIEQYKEFVLSASSNDGVYTTGPGYVHSRLYMDRRTQKKIFIDVCEYQGYNEFYSDSIFVNLYEWLYGYSVTPFNVTYSFGDSPPVKPIKEWATSALRADKFSEQAQSYAAWYLGPTREFSFKNTLLNYILVSSEPDEPIQPKSRIFDNGGAWLLGDDPTQDNFAAVLWNVDTEEESHSHLDANSINIVGYGDFLIRNSGYDNWQSPDPETWDWIHNDARSSNTVTIDNKNHTSFRGNGIVESSAGLNLEYATGLVAGSMPGGEHTRSLLSVKSEDGIDGYFIMFDEVKTEKAGSTINFYLHPNSRENPEVNEEINHYNFSIKQCYNLVDDLSINIILNKTPINIDLLDGYFGSYENCTRFIGKYMDIEYRSDASGKQDFCTIFIPQKNDEAVADINKIEHQDFRLTKLAFDNGVNDIIVKPTFEDELTYDAFKTKSNLLYARKKNGATKNLWIYRGTKFLDTLNNIGFNATEPITFVLNGSKGEIISDGTSLTFYYPGINQFMIDNKIIYKSESTTDSIYLKVPSGNHKFVFISDNINLERDNKNPKYFLSNTYPFYLAPYSKITFGVPYNENVVIILYDMNGNEIDRIYEGATKSGIHSVFFNSGKLSNGEYSYSLVTGAKTITKKFIIDNQEE